MARQNRIQYKDAWYHIINKGAGGKYILDDKYHNKETFIELLEQIHSKYKIEIHAYCIMDNHYHLLVKTPLANIAEPMKHLQAMFTRIYNKKMNSDGPIFRSRYKSFLIESEQYLLAVCRYIHLNPVEAKLKSGLNYKWSSYNYYCEPNNFTPSWLHTKFLTDYFNNSNCYADIQDYHLKSNDKSLINFYDKNEHNIFGIINERIQQTYELESLETTILNYFAISPDSLRQNIRGKSNIPQKIFIILARNIYKFEYREIATHLNIDNNNNISKINTRWLNNHPYINLDTISSINLVSQIEYLIKNN